MMSVGPCSTARAARRGSVRERAGDDALRGCGSLLDDRGRRRAPRDRARSSLCAQYRQPRQAHVDDDRLPRARERGPVEVHAAVLERAGHEHARLRESRCVSGMPAYAATPSAAVIPGTTSKRMPVRRQRLDLLAAAAEHERIAALETKHAPAFARVMDEERVDLFLAQRVARRGACRRRSARPPAAAGRAPPARSGCRRAPRRRAA